MVAWPAGLCSSTASKLDLIRGKETSVVNSCTQRQFLYFVSSDLCESFSKPVLHTYVCAFLSRHALIIMCGFHPILRNAGFKPHAEALFIVAALSQTGLLLEGLPDDDDWAMLALHGAALSGSRNAKLALANRYWTVCTFAVCAVRNQMEAVCILSYQGAFRCLARWECVELQ